MKTFFLSSVAIFVGAATLLFAQPKLEIVGGDTYDWGIVKTKNPLAGKVQIKNAGNKTLTISEVQAACGCTGTILDNKVLQPNEVATLSVTLNTGSNVGPIMKTVRIKSDDPVTAEKVLNLKANITLPIRLSVPYVVLSNLKVGQLANGETVLENKSGKDLLITSVELVGNGLKTNIKPNTVIKDNEMYKIVGSAIADKAGYYSGTIKLKTNDPDYSSVDIIVYGQATEDKSPAFAPQGMK